MTISLTRRVGKTAYGLVRGRSRRHWFDAWPGLAFERDDTGRWDKAVYRGQLAAQLLPCSSLTERPGGSIIVAGAGPSLREQNLNNLEDSALILTNGSLHLIERDGVQPLAVFIEDEGFVRHSPDLVVSIPAETRCFFTPPVVRAVCEINPRLLRRWRVSLVEILHRPLESRRPRPKDLAARPHVLTSKKGDAVFSTDCDQGFGSCGTVVYCALQLAVQCNPKRIGLVGVDLANFHRPRVHEARQNRASSHLHRRLSSILTGFELAASVCRERGIATENYSASSCIPREDFPYNDQLDKAYG